MKNRSRAHFFRVFLKSVFPVFLCEKLIAAEECDKLFHVTPFNDLTKPDVPGVGGGYHDQDVVGTYSKQVKPFKLALNQTIRNFFNDPNAMVGVNDFIAYLKCIHIPPDELALFYAGSLARSRRMPLVKPRLSRTSAGSWKD